MKTDRRYSLSWALRLRMLVRFLGLTAVLVAAAGALLLYSLLPDWQPETIARAVQGELGDRATTGAWLLLGGVLTVIFALIIEVVAAVSGEAGRKGAAGVSAAVQVSLATAVLVAVNVYAFLHDARSDLTLNRQFTLPNSLVSELEKLKSETTIVVLQQHKTFGQLSAKPDRYDYAAERKVVEKVLDLVDQFRKFGPQFRVVVLDVEEEGYDKKLAELTKDKPKLKDAIQAAPENSILFASEDKVQRMSFNEFYQLDKHASKTANADKGNLVLHPQGIESLVKRITAIEEKRPKVAVAVPHEALTTQVVEGNEELTLAGLRKTLTNYGFDVVDVVLKKNYRRDFEGDPASFTFQETKLVRLEGQLDEAKDEVNREKRFGERLERSLQKIELAKQKTPAERLDIYNDAFAEMTRRKYAFTDADRKNELVQKKFEAFILGQFDYLKKEHVQDLADAEEDLQQIEKDLLETQKQERAIEDRYLTDVKYKFSRLLADCDLLIVPRLTILNATARGGVLPRGLHRIDKQQADIIKDFMKAGKPVFVCAGPTNYPTEEPVPVSYDDLETILVDRGFDLGRQTILFNVEAKAFREKEVGDFGGTPVKLPPLRFTPPEDYKLENLKPNPVAEAMQVILNSIDQPLDIRIRAPRPVTVSRFQQEAQGFASDFLWTSARSWNETYPFNFMIRTQINPFNMQPQQVPVDMPPPRLDSSNETEAKGGGKGEERRGPFSIAAAVESACPADWYTEKERVPAGERKKSRVAVIGHGGLFTKPDLGAPTEKLLLVTCNWLLGRDERLPHAAAPNALYVADRLWKYPRVEMSESAKNLWHWGTFLGLPALFVYLGLVMMLVRRVR